MTKYLIRICGLHFFCALLLLPGCSLWNKRDVKKPKVQLESVEVTSADALRVSLNVGIHVDNPNPYPLKVDAVEYAIEVGGRNLVREKIEEPREVAANQVTVIYLPVTLKYLELIASVGDFLIKEKAEYRIKGSARTGLFSLPFEESGQLVLTSGQLQFRK